MPSEPLPLIQSRDNPRYKALRKLAESARARRDAGVLLLDGVHLLQAYGAALGPVREVYVLAGTEEKPEHQAWLAAQGPGLGVTRLAPALFREVVDTDSPAGLLGLAPRPDVSGPPDSGDDAVLLDGVQDPGNLGTLMRTAAAAGVRQILLSPGCTDPWSPRALRAGQGAQFLLQIHPGIDLAEYLLSFPGKRLATRLNGASDLYDLTLLGPNAWVFGAEGLGVSAGVAAAVSHGVRIPMAGETESLNVAAAAAICLFEALRQRRQAGEPIRSSPTGS